MKRLFIFSLIFIFLSGCNTTAANTEKLHELYIAALDELMITDDGLNHDMAFIAIDMTTMPDLSSEEKTEIINYFSEAYDIEVKTATFEELKEQGYFNEDTLTLDGVLLSFDHIEQKGKSKFIFEGKKYRSGLGAIGLKITVKKKNDGWAVTESIMLWIS